MVLYGIQLVFGHFAIPDGPGGREETKKVLKIDREYDAAPRYIGVGEYGADRHGELPTKDKGRGRQREGVNICRTR